MECNIWNMINFQRQILKQSPYKSKTENERERFMLNLRSLGPGHNPVCDLWGPIINNYKGFARKASWEKATLKSDLVTAWRELWSRPHSPPPLSTTILLCVHAFLAKTHPLGSLLIEGPLAWPFLGACAETSFSEVLEETFLYSDSGLSHS